MAWYCWLATLCTLGLILFIAGAMDLFSKKPDFESDESEWESGSVDVERANKDQSDIDIANRVREQFDNDGA